MRSLRILLRPGSFYMNEAIRVQSLHSITLETMHLPENCFQLPSHRQTTLQNTNGSHKELPEAPAQNRSARSLRDLLLCRTNSSVEVAAQHHQQEQLEPTDFSDYDNAWETDSLADYHYRTPCTRATLVLRSRKANEPAFYVRQGTLCIKDINIHHHSEGLDIWNGNAAIQIQPDVQEGDPPLPQHLLPHAVLDSVHITSYSGRGIVSIDGGSVHMRGCAVEDCAATGIYIGGGPGTQAHVERSDVVNNGVGNPHRRTGIARGHSGVYLEQGTARITDCNISNNTLTGISAVSPSNAILALEHCDLMSNGTNQLEMPSRGTVARQRSVTRHNHMSVAGRGRSRSGLLVVQQQQRRVGSFGGL